MQQGSEEWFLARLGKLTGSRCHDAVAKTKSGYSTSRKRYMDELIEQRLTGVIPDNFVSRDMIWGIETEPHARARYEWEKMVDVVEVGSIPHPTIANASASPDGLVGDDGLVEIKCPRTTTMINTVISNAIPANYVTQMNWQLACTQRKWCDFVMFDPRLPVDNQIWIVRHVPEPGVIEELEGEVEKFLIELDERINDFLSVMGN